MKEKTKTEKNQTKRFIRVIRNKSNRCYVFELFLIIQQSFHVKTFKKIILLDFKLINFSIIYSYLGTPQENVHYVMSEDNFKLKRNSYRLQYMLKTMLVLNQHLY